MKSSYDGKQENIRRMKLPAIGVWKNKYPDKDYVVKLDCPEFTCVCPKTGLADFARILVEYVPDRSCVELKSFKEYLASYRDIGIFHEHAANRILEDLVKAARPRRMKVTGVFNARGGIETTIEAEYEI